MSSFFQRDKKLLKSFDFERLKQFQIQLRKEKRIDESLKRRFIFLNTQHNAESKDSDRHLDLGQILSAFTSNQIEEILPAAQALRNILNKKTSPIQEVIDAGIVPYLISFIQQYDLPQLQFEALWAIINISSGSSDQCQAVLEATPILIQLLRSPNAEIKEQSVWALGNIAADSTSSRDKILMEEGLAPLMIELQSSPNLEYMRNLVWTISNLCRGKPAPDYSKVKQALKDLGKLIHSDDKPILNDALWALSSFSQKKHQILDVLLETDCLSRIVSILPREILPAVRIIGNIAYGTESQTQAVIDSGAIHHLCPLIHSQDKKIASEVLWVFSNLCAESPKQLEKIIEAGAISLFIDKAYCYDNEIKEEVVWCLANACAAGQPQQVARIVDLGAIPALCSLCQTNGIQTIALEGLYRILRSRRETYNEFYARSIEECGGLTVIEQLTTNPSENVRNKAQKIIDTYFDFEYYEDKYLIDSSSIGCNFVL